MHAILKTLPKSSRKQGSLLSLQCNQTSRSLIWLHNTSLKSSTMNCWREQQYRTPSYEHEILCKMNSRRRFSLVAAHIVISLTVIGISLAVKMDFMPRIQLTKLVVKAITVQTRIGINIVRYALEKTFSIQSLGAIKMMKSQSPRMTIRYVVVETRT